MLRLYLGTATNGMMIQEVNIRYGHIHYWQARPDRNGQRPVRRVLPNTPKPRTVYSDTSHTARSSRAVPQEHLGGVGAQPMDAGDPQRRAEEVWHRTQDSGLAGRDRRQVPQRRRASRVLSQERHEGDAGRGGRGGGLLVRKQERAGTLQLL
jgi:hypothetical protein